jgi:hypothetical protein
MRTYYVDVPIVIHELLYFFGGKFKFLQSVMNI